MPLLKCLLVSAFVFIGLTSHAQSTDYDKLLEDLTLAKGKERAKLLLRLCNFDINNDQDLTKQRALEALSISQKINYSIGIGGSYRYIGLSHHFAGDLDSARVYYNLCKDYYTKPKDIGWSYYNIASLFEYESRYDSALYYLDFAEEFFLKDSSLVELGSLISMRGTIAQAKGNNTEGGRYFYEAMQLFEEAGDESRKADMIRQLSSSESSFGNYEKAINYAQEANQIYKDQNDTYYQAEALSTIASYYKDLSQLDSAEYYFKQAISLGESSNNYTTTLSSLSNLAGVYLENDKLDLALKSIEEADNKISPDESIYEYAIHYLVKGTIYQRLNQSTEALTSLLKSVEISKQINAPTLIHDAYITTTKVHEQQGNYELAYRQYRRAKVIKDSLDRISQSKELQDILVNYETEKKDAEIALLNKEAELDTTKKRSLWCGIILLSLAALTTIYSLMQRSKKKQALLSKEKAIEQEKRKHAEEELEYKKKELTAKALQLASKNEFLYNLEQEIGSLKSSADSIVSSTSNKVSRMINNDQLDDKEWELFGKEFSSIHQDFKDRLTSQYGDFSNYEWRLISLLKMNLSSKDIANIFRISPNGVKKARYRLRKKIDLASEMDIQDFLISF